MNRNLILNLNLSKVRTRKSEVRITKLEVGKFLRH